MPGHGEGDTLRMTLEATDDATARAAVEGADPLALWAATYQLSGDARLARLARTGGADPSSSWEQLRPPDLADPADVALVRQVALELVGAWRAGATPVAPTPERYREVLEALIGETVPDAHLAWWWEEFAVEPLPRGVPPVTTRAADRPFRVLVIGAGMNGIGAAISLGAAGIDYLVVEKNAGVGGTWYENTYPGARVDVASRSYSYSFEPAYPWEHHFALQTELATYFEHIVDRYGLRDHIRFGTEVEAARWLEDDGVWEVRLRASAASGPDEVTTIAANAIVSAVGLFNRPKRPDLDGLDDFEGHVVHTARWDHHYDLSTKRVALIGTGASGTQLVAGVAPQVASLTIFQRAGTWVSNMPHYTEPIGPAEQWLIAHFPYYVNWVRVLTSYSLSDRRLPIYDVDPEWDDPDSVSAINHKMRSALVNYLTTQLEGRPDLIEKCIPGYPVMAKRLPKDNGWFAALRRDNVHLVTEPIDRVTPTGVRTTDGVDHDADLLVLATGFRVNDFLWPMHIEGEGGVTLEEAWQKDGARAYLGMTIPGFPNLFCMYGPNSNSKSGGICMWGEFQARYLTLCVKYLIEHGRRAMAVRPDVFERFNRALDDRLANSVWLDQRQVSYYRNAYNRVGTQAPWATLEYWQMTREPDLTDFVVT